MSEGFCDTADGDASQMYDVAVALLDGTLSAEESQSLVGLLRNDAGRAGNMSDLCADPPNCTGGAWRRRRRRMAI